MKFTPENYRIADKSMEAFIDAMKRNLESYRRARELAEKEEESE